MSELVPLHTCYGCYLGFLVGLLTMGLGISLTLLPAFVTHFVPLGCLVNLDMRVCALSCCGFLWAACTFLKGNGREMNLGEKGGTG